MSYRGKAGGRAARRAAHKASAFSEAVKRATPEPVRLRPRPVMAFDYIDRIERYPLTDPYDTQPRERIWLKTLIGNENERMPRRMLVPCLETPSFAMLSSGLNLETSERMSCIEFTWRAYGIRKGGTDVRWYVPEIANGSSKPEYAARTACAMLLRARAEIEYASMTQFGLEQAGKAVHVAFDAIEDWLGVL